MIAHRRDRVMWMNDGQTHILNDKRSEIVTQPQNPSGCLPYLHNVHYLTL